MVLFRAAAVRRLTVESWCGGMIRTVGQARLCERRPTILRHRCKQGPNCDSALRRNVIRNSNHRGHHAAFAGAKHWSRTAPLSACLQTFRNMVGHSKPRDCPGSRPCPTLHPTGRNFIILHGVAQMGRHASTSFPILLAPRPLPPSLPGLRRLVAPIPTIGPGPHDEIVGLLSIAQRARRPLLIVWKRGTGVDRRASES